MNKNQKRRVFSDFLDPNNVVERNRNEWTEDDVLSAAKRIMKRLGLTETLYKPGDEVYRED